jgi:pyruvate dehydrogenase E2 component (dihydrolipoamide acetyltransferase)
MIIKATAIALRKHPQVNSSWAGDKIIHRGNINIGVAVAIPDGLVVPVLKNTDQMNYTQISAAVKDMASRAKTKVLKLMKWKDSLFLILECSESKHLQVSSTNQTLLSFQ